MFKKSINTVMLSMVLLMNTACTLLGIRTQETPGYQVIVKDGNKEIRLYGEYLIAKTTVTGSYKDAQSKAFRKLAGYIFGKNTKRQKISMTAPVTQSQSERIKMTAPVTQYQEKDKWTMTFMLPKKYSMASLPAPKDKSIEFEARQKAYYAVITYSGHDSTDLNHKKVTELRAWLEQFKQYQVISTPVFAGYNPPWTVSFLRKNEMMLKLKKVK